MIVQFRRDPRQPDDCGHNRHLGPGSARFYGSVMIEKFWYDVYTFVDNPDDPEEDHHECLCFRYGSESRYLSPGTREQASRVKDPVYQQCLALLPPLKEPHR